MDRSRNHFEMSRLTFSLELADSVGLHFAQVFRLTEYQAHVHVCTPRYMIKGTRCLGSVELVFIKRSVTICYKIGMGRKML